MSFPGLVSIPSQLTDFVISKMRTTAFFRMRRTCKHFNSHIEKKKEKFRKMIPVDRIELSCDEGERDWKQCVHVVSNKLNHHSLPDNFETDDLCRVKAMCISVTASYLFSPFIGETLQTFYGRVTCRELECEVETEDALAALVEILKPSIVTVKWVYAPRRDILSSSVFGTIEEIVLETDGNVDLLCCNPNVQYLKVTSEYAEGDAKAIAEKLGKPDTKLKRVHIVNKIKIHFQINLITNFETKSVLTIYNGDTYVRAKSREERSALYDILESAKKNQKNGRHETFEGYDTDDEFDKSLHSHYTDASFYGSDQSHLSDSSFLNMENFEGIFKQIKSEKFDDYLKEVGVNYLLRKVAGAANASIEFKNNGDGTWTFYFYSTVKNGTWRFKVGEESEETTPDGRHVMSTITIEDGKLVHRQKAIKSGEKDSLIVRTRVGDEIHSTISCNGVVATAIDKKQ